jgi:hypothetical protein
MTDFYHDVLNSNCEWIRIFLVYGAHCSSGFGAHENTLEPGLFLEKSVLKEKIVFHCYQGMPQMLVLQKCLIEVL